MGFSVYSIVSWWDADQSTCPDWLSRKLVILSVAWDHQGSLGQQPVGWKRDIYLTKSIERIYILCIGLWSNTSTGVLFCLLSRSLPIIQLKTIAGEIVEVRVVRQLKAYELIILCMLVLNDVFNSYLLTTQFKNHYDQYPSVAIFVGPRLIKRSRPKVHWLARSLIIKCCVCLICK